MNTLANTRDFAGEVSGFDKQIDDLEAEHASAVDRLDTTFQTQSDALEAERKGAAAQVESLLKTGPPKIDTPAFAGKHVDPEQMQRQAGLMMTIAGLAGLLTKRPMINALTSMTAAVEGLKQGDDEQYKRSVDEYKIHFDEGMKKAAELTKEYERILRSSEYSLAEKDRLLHQLSAQHGLDVGKANQSFTTRANHLQSLKQGVLKSQQEHDALVQKLDAAAAQKDADRQARKDHDEMMAAIRSSQGPGSHSLTGKLDEIDALEAAHKITKEAADAQRNILLFGKGNEGSVNARIGGRLVGAMNQISVHLGNLANLPADSQMGALADIYNRDKDTFFKALGSASARHMTSEENRLFEQEAAAIEKELSALALPGYGSGSRDLVAELRNSRPGPGDSVASVAAYLALARQQVEASKNEIEVWPAATKPMKELAAQATQSAKEAVPWTVSDVNKFVLKRSGQDTIKNSVPKEIGTASVPNTANQRNDIPEDILRGLKKYAPRDR